MRVCPFPDCGVSIPDYLFCCKADWNRLSTSQQRRIYAVWNDYKRDRIGMEELRRVQQQVMESARSLFNA